MVLNFELFGHYHYSSLYFFHLHIRKDLTFNKVDLSLKKSFEAG